MHGVQVGVQKYNTLNKKLLAVRLNYKDKIRDKDVSNVAASEIYPEYFSIFNTHHLYDDL